MKVNGLPNMVTEVNGLLNMTLLKYTSLQRSAPVKREYTTIRGARTSVIGQGPTFARVVGLSVMNANQDDAKCENLFERHGD